MTTRQDPDSELSDLYQRLLVSNQEAFALEAYEVAYHALMAALHCVAPLPDFPTLDVVELIAQEQLAWLDQHHPEYEHSTPSAQKRGEFSLYYTLARQAQARRQRIQAHAQWQATQSDPLDRE